MATEKPRFSVTFSDESYEKIQRYKKEQNLSTQSKAVAKLVALALHTLEESGELKTAPPLSEEAMRLAKDYADLDFHGQRMVQMVVDEEKTRMREEEDLFRNPLADPEPKVINLFVEPSAAGIAVPTMGQDYELYTLKPDDPQGAAYAVRIQGDSMEPDFPDGSVVFVNHDAMRDGEIGIFSVDGGTVCKQYHQEGGVVYLFSLNRRREDADVVLLPGGNRGFVCQGRVITRKRYPVPGRG